MVAGPTRARGKSELHRARAPGESRGGVLLDVDSPDWRAGDGARATETKPGGLPSGVKRAILPAAISDSAVCRWLAEAGSREPPRRQRRGRSPLGPREMTITNRTRLTPLLSSSWCL